MRAAGFVILSALALSAESIGDLYPNLQRALQLTTEQWSRVGDQSRAYQSFLNEKAERLTQIDQELRAEQVQPVLDPLALGVRHVEAASICRESAERLKALRDGFRQALNVDQRARFDRLEAGKALLPALAEGQRLMLADTSVEDVLPAPGEAPNQSEGWRASRTYGDLLPGCALPGGFGFSWARSSAAVVLRKQPPFPISPGNWN